VIVVVEGPSRNRGGDVGVTISFTRCEPPGIDRFDAAGPLCAIGYLARHVRHRLASGSRGATVSNASEVPTLGDEAQRFLAELDIKMPAASTDASSTVTKLIGGSGPADVGIVATVVDLIAGHFILGQAWPCGISTTEMTLHGIHRLRRPGLLVATARLVSMTRTRGCVEIDLSIDGSDRGTATALAVFNLFRFDDDALALEPPGDWSPGESSASLDEVLWARAGIELDPVGHAAAVALRPEIANHVSSLQGGVTVALLEAAASTHLDPSTEIRSVSVSYLSQGRVGPFRAAARLTGPDGDVVVVDAVDLGNDDRPLAHGVFSTWTPSPPG
jgi:acyl-coenzyme A thioesterase PaaI-like protein